jgi:hypothetical protein
MRLGRKLVDQPGYLFDPDLMPLGRAVRLAEEALGASLAPARRPGVREERHD